jgi:hypothetical protein
LAFTARELPAQDGTVGQADGDGQCLGEVAVSGGPPDRGDLVKRQVVREGSGTGDEHAAEVEDEQPASGEPDDAAVRDRQLAGVSGA